MGMEKKKQERTWGHWRAKLMTQYGAEETAEERLSFLWREMRDGVQTYLVGYSKIAVLIWFHTWK